MTEQLRESVSALVDGEVSELELRRILKSEDADTVLTSWSRYQRVRGLMQGEDSRFANMDISARVMAVIDEQPPLRRTAAWWKPLGGAAVAASVAALVVFGLAPDQQFTASEAAPAIASTTGRVYPLQSLVPASRGQSGNVNVNAVSQFELPVAQQSPDGDAVMRQRMEQLLLRHTERAALNNGEGMISFARVVSFDAE